MSVTFDELPDSPKFKFSSGNLTISRQGLIAWTDIDAFMEELYPQSVTYGNVNTSAVGAAYPGRAAFRVKTYDISPFHKEEVGRVGSDSSTGIPLHDYALVTIEYTVPPAGTVPDSSQPANFDPKELLSHQINSGGQFLTIPNTGFIWDGGTIFPATAVKVPDKTIQGVFVSTSEHHVVDPIVEDPNWGALEAYKGMVNDDAFTLRGFSYPEECLMYLGYEAKQVVRTFVGTRGWEIGLKFSIKMVSPAVNPLTGGFLFTDENDVLTSKPFVGGHNHFWRESGPVMVDGVETTVGNFWQRVRRGTDTPSGTKGMFLRADMTQLFRSGTDYNQGT